MKEAPSGIPKREVVALIAAYVIVLALFLLLLDSRIRDPRDAGSTMDKIGMFLALPYLISTAFFFFLYNARDKIWKLKSLGYDYKELTLEDYNKPELAFAKEWGDSFIILYGIIIIYLFGYIITLWLAKMAVYGITTRFDLINKVRFPTAEPWLVVGVMAMASIVMYYGDRILAKSKWRFSGVSHPTFFNSLLRLALDMPPVLIVSGFLWGSYWWVVLLMFIFQFGIFVWNSKKYSKEKTARGEPKPSKKTNTRL